MTQKHKESGAMKLRLLSPERLARFNETMDLREKLKA